MKYRDWKETEVLKRVARKEKKGTEGKGRVGTTKEKDCAKGESKGQRKEGTWMEEKGWQDMKTSKGKEKQSKPMQGKEGTIIRRNER